MLYAEGFGWGRPMEILLCEVTTLFLKDPSRAASNAGSLNVPARWRAPCSSSTPARTSPSSGSCIPNRGRAASASATRWTEVVEFSRAAGYARIRLWTHSVLAPARRIYERFGFRIVS
ncbi:MAG TPA: hypothetical protein VGD19_11865, partial [Allosphingosinicella sp.]